jgi:ATP-dependent helicase/nuclease subunit B
VSVLCLVPTPLRATRAARRLCDAQAGILLGAQVTTLERLVPAALAAARDARPVLSPLAERLLALEAGGHVDERVARLAPGGGLARALAGSLGELRRAEVVPGAVRAAAAALGGAAGARLHLLAAALEAWRARLESAGALDRSGALRAAAEAVERGVAPDELRELDVLVLEGFRALSPAAMDLAVALARRARRTELRLPFFPQRPDLCAPVEPLLRRLEALHELAADRDVTIALEDLDAPGRAPPLARVLAAMAGGPGAPDGGAAGAVLAAAAAGEDAEAEVAAELAARLVERGFAWEDIAVVAPAPDRAAPALARAFAAAGLPFAPGCGPALSAALPVQASLLALAAAVRPGRAALEAVAASPYLGAALPARLAFWLDRAGALDGRGDPEAALRARAAALASPTAARERSELLRTADALAGLSAALRPLGAPGLPREHAARLRGFLAAAGARRRAARAPPEVASRDLGALGRLEEVADELARALAALGRGERRVPAAEWEALLGSAVAGASATPPPEPAAGAIELWPVAEAPGLSARAVLVVGCGRGAFPVATPADPFLRDAERAAVNRAAGRAALASGPLRRAEATHAAFCALAAGREAVAVTWAAPGPGGGGGPPAPLALELIAAAGLTPPPGPERDPGLAASRTAPAALRAAARLARHGRAEDALAALPAEGGLRARAASAAARGAVELARGAAIASRRAHPYAGGLSPELHAELARALPHEWTPTQLEKHARCPFQLFAGVVLRLAEPEAAELDIDPRDEGSLAHAVLERFLRARLGRHALPLRGGDDERSELRAVAAELFSSFERDGRTGDPALWAGRRAAVLARLERVVRAEAEARDEAIPALLEYRFGGDSGVPPLVFDGPQGQVRLQGRVDRVDAAPDRLVVVDYKNSGSPLWRKKLEREALGDTNFQVPAYLLAAARALPGRKRFEATYLLLRSAERLPPFTSATDEPLLAVDPVAREAARALGVRPFADAVIDAVASVRRGELSIAPRDCSGCAFGAVCRAEAVAEEVP